MISVEKYKSVLNFSKRRYNDVPEGIVLTNSLRTSCHSATVSLVKSILSSVKVLEGYGRFLGVSLDVDDGCLLPIKVIYFTYKSNFTTIQCRVDLCKSLSYWNLMDRILHDKPYKRDYHAYSTYWKVCLSAILEDYDADMVNLLAKVG